MLSDQMQQPNEIAIYNDLVRASVPTLYLYLLADTEICFTADSWAFHLNKPHDRNDFTVGCTICFQDTITMFSSLKSFSEKTLIIGRKHRNLAPRHAVLRRQQLQIAVTNIVDFGATSKSSPTSMRSRHVTKSKCVVEPRPSIRKLPDLVVLPAHKMQTLFGTEFKTLDWIIYLTT